MTSMKKVFKKGSITTLLFVFFAMAAAGCGKSEGATAKETAAGEAAAEETTAGETATDEATAKEEGVIYPVSVDGSEILIGETTVQALLDKGLKMTVSEMSEDYEITEYEIDPEAELEANSYYSGGSIWLSDSSFVQISVVTDEENIRMGDAVIGYLEFWPDSEDSAVLNKIQFNGVPLSELTREKAEEVFPDFSGDENMWFSPAAMLDYSYFMSFDSNGTLNKFSVEKKYEVDWSGEN